MCPYIDKRNYDLIYSVVKSPMKTRLYNIETFKHLNRTLIRWLDEDIVEDGKIKRIQMFDTRFN